VDNKQLFLSALVGGLVMAILWSVPGLNLINCLICAGIWLGGIVAVWFYRRQTGQMVTGGQAAVIGAVAGLIGAILGTVGGAVLGGATMASLIAADPTGTAEEALGSFVAGGALSLLSFFINIVLFPLFGAIGGAAYAAIAKPPTTPKVG
jgi:hypothetical protein